MIDTDTRRSFPAPRPDGIDRLRRTLRAGIAALLVAVFAMPAYVAAPGAHASERPDSFADLAERLLPTVVNVSTTQRMDDRESERFEDFFRDFFERRGEEGVPRGPRRSPSALGSGFIIDPEGYIVTNNHVIADADEISVRLHDETVLEAEIIGRDDKTDLALLKVETDRSLEAASWGDSESIRIGDWVLAIGNPFGLGGSVTAGIVSARSRDINAGPYDDFIQTDAAINRGNSGGPMFNTAGEVIGVNTAIYSPSGGSVGIGFAIPSAIANNVIDQLRDHGDVRRAWLGVRIQSVTDELAEGLRLEDSRGALVASVTDGGPAAQAGIRQGDVILSFDGRTVDEMRRLPRLVADSRIGKTVDVEIWRQGERKMVQVELEELREEQLARAMPSDEGPPETTRRELDSLGLALAPLDDQARRDYGLDDRATGVLVTDVLRGGNAADKGLTEGDVIVEVDQEEVNTPDDVAKKIEEAEHQGYRVVTLLIYSQGDFRWVAVRIG